MRHGNDLQAYPIDTLIKKALKSRHLGVKLLRTEKYNERKNDFQEILVRSAKIASTSEPQEISKVQVDVNEKFYTNLGYAGFEGGDASTVKITKTWETSQGYNYEQQTTSGFEWGTGVNIGAQFGLPQVGIGGNIGGNASFTKKVEESTTTTSTNTNTVRQESHHEETVKIPPGHRIRVTMTSYRVKYKLDYSMEYNVPHKTSIMVPYWPCYCYCCCCCYLLLSMLLMLICGFLVLPIIPLLVIISKSCRNINRTNCFGIVAPTCKLSAGSIFRRMPQFSDEGGYITFTQEGVLKWSADRMVVDKQFEKLE